jgi:hypothetical protein
MSWSGALILYNIEGTNDFLLGKESLYLWEKTGNKTVDDLHEKTQTVQSARINLKNFETREKLTKLLVKQVEHQIEKENLKIGEWLVPPVYKSSQQGTADPGQVLYKSHVRKSRNDEEFGVPKGGKEPDDSSPLHTILREIEEEIGSIDKDLLPKEENAFEEKASNGYTIFYKAIKATDAQKIKEEIQRRKQLHIGEMFDLEFRNIREANSLAKTAFEKIKSKLSSLKTQAEEAKDAAEKIEKRLQELTTVFSVKTVTGPRGVWGKPKTAKKRMSGGARKRGQSKKQTRRRQ